ncbi:MAG TPA: C25 family cysteine peptidase, partial [Bacteroidales bacterium]|nr:C25 family cysteine peptidase [Bacteroidales bacterium]
MKTVLKSLVSLILLIAFSVVLHAQQPYRLMQNDSEKIRLRLNSTTLNSVEVKTEAGYFSRLMMDQFHSSVQVGDPELPTLVKLIEIPLCSDIELRVTPGEFTIYNAVDLDINYPVFPAQPSYSKSYEGPITLIKNDSTYEQNQFFAAAPLVTVKPIGQMRDYNLAELTFSPVSYNPVTGQLKVYQSVEVEIRFVNSRPEETAAMKRVYGTPMMSIPGSLLMNPPAPQSAEMNHTPIKMVIVSHPIFETQLAPYIEWKKRKGFIVDLALTSNPNVGTTTATIKNYLKAQYDNATDTDPAPTFVLFVGDVAQVPTFQGVTDDHVTDLYYVTFTDGDYLPDAYYGRFSATNSTELAPQLEKTLMYEMFTMPDPTYLDDAVLVAGTDNNWSLTHANGQVNYLSDNYINTGYGYSNIYKHLYPASLQAALIRQEIGNGVGFANYSAHCSPAGWGDPAFTTQHVPAMNNENKYGLMIGNCCQSGMFNNSVCFGEALLRADKKGAMAYIGASNYTYWNEDFYWAVGLRATVTANPVYQSNNLGAYDRLFHTHDEDYNEWMVSNMGICQAGNLAVQSSTSERKKYYWEVYHLFGDPSVISYLTQPEVMDVTAPEVLTVGISSLPLTVAPYAYVALVKDGVLIGANFADGTGAVTLTFNPLTETGEYELAAWGQNYQQYFDTINVIDPSGAGCLAPIGITCTNATNTSMAIDWVYLVTANSWKIEYGVSGFTQGTGTVVQVTAHPATIIGLTASTCYDFYVQPICASSGPGDWSQKQTFCTHQIPLNVPFTIDFETPSGFGFANNPSGANWYIGNATGVNNTTGGNHGLYISGDNGNINMYDNTPGVVWAYRDVYFTPSTIDYVLTFDWKCLGEEYFDYFNLYIGSPAQPVADNTGTITMPAGATALATFMGLQDSWREASYILSAADYSGQTKRLYFCWKNNDSVVNQPPAAIDNIRLKVLSCFSPSELVASTITGNSVTLVWNENSSATAWEVEYGAPGFIIGTVVQAGTNPFILTGLNPYTPYEVRVRAVCNVNDYSMWSSRINFTTACGTFELPFFDDFSISPACWTQTYSGGVTSNRWEYISNGTFAGGTAGEMRARYVTGTGVSRLISPLVRFNNATAAELSFKHYYINDGPGVTIKLQCSPDLVTWTDLPFSHSGGNINPTTELVQFVPMADSLYFAWVIDGNHYNIYYWFIDDVSITSGCLTPVEVSFSNITTTSVDIEWVDFIAGNAWEVEYGTPGFTSGTIVPVSTIPFTLTGLDHSTIYEVRVRNICGDNEHGPWSSRVRFVTTCLSKELPFLEDFSAPPACWTQTYSGGITSERWSHFPYSTITGGTDAGEMRATWVNETGVSRLISPLIRFDDVVAAELSFRHYYSNDVPGVVLKVQCSSDLETWTDLSFSHSGGSIPAITQIIQFIPMADSLYFAWVIDGNHYSINYWYIDDVSIIETSGCMFPTEITYSNVTTTTVDIGWVDPAIGNTWEVEYGIPGFTSGTVVPASTNSITLTGLNHSTTYEFRVRTICDVNDYSTWSMRVSFSTLCSATELPFLEDFSTLPLCWGQTYSGGITSDVWGYDPGGMEAGGSAGELVAVWTDGVGVTRLISPLIRLNDVVGLELSFKHYYDNDNPGVLLKVQCSPDLETWTDLPFSHSGGDIAATTEIIQFVPIEDSLYFAWVMDGDHYDIHYWHIDDVSIIEKIVCVTPVGVSYSNVTPTSVDIEWVDPAIGNTWEVEYGAPGFISGTVVQASTNPFTLTGLNHSTAYEFRVRAVCGVDEYSMWSSRVSFVTTCLATELPFLEDFSAPPACWTQTYSGEITSDRWDYSPYGTDAGGDAGEMVGSWINGVGVSRLISPLISFDNVAAAELSFKHYYDYFSSGVTIKLQCSPDLLTWTDLSFSHSSGDIFATTEIIQFVPIADSLYFAWVVDGDHYSFDNWYIDDVSIISGCLTPLEVSCSNVTSNSVDIEWVDHTVGNTWEIEYGESGFTQGTGTTVQTTTHPVTISGLTALTCYDVYVKAICAPGEESNWSLKRTFCTSQNPVEVPFMIDFETESGFEFANNPSGNNWYVGNAAGVNNTPGGSNGLYVSSDGGTTNIYNNTNAVVWAYRDIYFTPSTSDYTLTFDWKCRGERLSGTSYDYFNVYIGIPALPVARTTSTIMVPAGATALATRLNQQTSWQEASYTLPFADYSGQTMRLYFCWRNDYSGAYQPPAAIDNIEVTSNGITTCLSPINLAISNISSTGATATWTAGGSETSWQIEYKTAAATSWTTQVANTATYTITGLQPSTTYQVRVKSLCGTNVESPYTTVVTFTTAAPPCVTPTNLTISNISSTGATATWTAGGSETSWQIEYKTA